jgi:adenylate kinase
MTCIVAVTGLSGVGKTTFLRRLQTELPFRHLQAGSLIKTARDSVQIDTMARDELRHLDIDENQKLLVAAFRSEITAGDKLTILDGHTLIEHEANVSLVSAHVFAAMGINAMIFLRDDPASILARRQSDATRKRPILSLQELKQRQEMALEQGNAIAQSIEIPFWQMSPSDHLECQRRITSIPEDTA